MNPEKILLVVLTLVIISFAGCIATKENEDRQRELELYKTNFDAGPPHPESDFDRDMCYYPLLDYIERTKSLLFIGNRYQEDVCLLRLGQDGSFSPFTLSPAEVSGYTQLKFGAVAANPREPFMTVKVILNAGSQEAVTELWLVPFPWGEKSVIYSSDRDVEAFSWSPDGNNVCYIERWYEGNDARGRLCIWDLEKKSNSQIAEFTLLRSSYNWRAYKPQWDSTGRYVYAVTEEGIVRVDVKTGGVKTVCPGETMILFDDNTLIVVRESGKVGDILGSEDWRNYSVYTFFKHDISKGIEKPLIRTASYGISFPLLSPSKRYICFFTRFQPSFPEPLKMISSICIFDFDNRRWCMFDAVFPYHIYFYDWIEPNEAWLEALKKLPETPAKAD